MLIVSEARIDTKGKLCIQLWSHDVSLSSRLHLNLMGGNTAKESMADL